MFSCSRPMTRSFRSPLVDVAMNKSRLPSHPHPFAESMSEISRITVYTYEVNPWEILDQEYSYHFMSYRLL